MRINNKKNDENKKKETSIKINPDLWKTAKIEAVKYNITLTELLEEAITEYIKKRKKMVRMERTG